MIVLLVTKAHTLHGRIGDHHQETLSQLIKRVDLIEPLPIETHGLITDIIHTNLYPLLPEIEFGEVPKFEKEEPSWFATHPEAFTQEDLGALYLQWYGNDY